jgi:hypothetical protein
MLAATLAAGESNPSWWSYASPEATAIVGIQWENVRQSVFAEAVGAELSSLGSLGFPDLPCIREARQILISSPELLAMAAGNFPPSGVQGQAAAKKMKRILYRGIALYVSPVKETLSMAQIDEQLLLIGQLKTLESAIDRSQWSTGPIALRYSPLLSRAARAASAGDLWVVANRLPDPLASLFVPLEIAAEGFDGVVSVRGGLHLDATVRTGTAPAAADIAESLTQSIPDMPGVAKGLQVSVTGDRVLLGLDLNSDQLAASLRQPERVPVPAPEPAVVPAPAAPAVVAEKPKPPEPQVIRIFGLDEGPREIVLPPEPRF